MTQAANFQSVSKTEQPFVTVNRDEDPVLRLKDIIKRAEQLIDEKPGSYENLKRMLSDLKGVMRRADCL